MRSEDVGMSNERLQRIERHLREHYVESGKIAGAVTLVARRGQIAYLSAVGQRDRERKKPMTEDTLFRIYSMTKPVTSVALMMLVEEARCSLSDPVARYIPSWEALRVFRYGTWPNFVTEPPRRPMTIRDLLTHMSGLTYGFAHCDPIDAAYRRVGVGGMIPGEERPSTLSDMAEKLATVPLLFSPGTRWNYSLSTDVVGYLVEVISGKSFDKFVRERIFDPLGMRQTDFRVPPGCGDRFAANYRRQVGSGLVLHDDPEQSPFLHDQTFFGGGAGLLSTAEDYRRFCQMLLNGGHYDGKRLLGKKTIELMTANHLPSGQDLSALGSDSFSETTYDGVGFGLGFAVLLDVAKRQCHGSPGEYYWGGAASTAFFIDPVEQLIMIFMTQLMPSTAYDIRTQLRSLVYSAIID